MGKQTYRMLQKSVKQWVGCILIVLLYPWSILQGQSAALRFERLSSDIGLTHSTINCFLQDHKGYLWFGTWSGLGRYDGFGVKLFRQQSGNLKSWTTDQITSMLEDRQQRIWIGTLNAGIFRYDYHTEQFTNYRFQPDTPNSLSDNDVWSLFEDRKGFIWIGTKLGLNRFDPQTGTFMRIYAPYEAGETPASDYIYSISETEDGSIWSATTRGILRISFSDSNTYTLKHYLIHEQNGKADSTLENFVYKIRPSLQERNMLWVGTKAGLKKIKYGTTNEAIEVVAQYKSSSNPQSLSNSVVSDFLETIDGKLWISTYNGLNRFDTQTEKFERFYANPDDPNSLTNNKVTQLFMDRSGILWIGTNKGISKLNLKQKPFQNFKKFVSGPSPSSSVTYVAPGTSKNQLWVGVPGGITRMDYVQHAWKSTQYTLHPPKLSDFASFVSSVVQDSTGNLWVSTQGAGLFFIRKKDIPSDGGRITRMVQYTRGQLYDDYIMALYEMGDTWLWIGLWDGGIDLLNRKTGEIQHFSTVGGINLMAFANVAFAQTVEQNGRTYLWVGTRGNGLLKMYFDEARVKLRLEQQFRSRMQQKGSLSNDKVNALYVDSKKQLWVSTSAGLNVLPVGRQVFKGISVPQGLPDLAVQSALEDAKGAIWVSTQNGIAQISQTNGKMLVRSYDVRDGLQDNFFNSNCALRLSSGLLAFGGVEGLTLFDPMAIRIDSIAPHAAITDFQLFNKSVLPGRSENGRVILKQPLAVTREIVLNHKENVLSFEFVGLHFSEPIKNRYAYKLEGFDDAWTYTDAQKRYVHYTNLPYRSFIFKVKAANSDGIWGPAESIRIRVKPPFWLTYWAFAVYGLAFLGMLYGIWWIANLRATFRNRLMLEQLEREKVEEVSRVKLQFFTNISHELRTPLALILSPLEQLLKEGKPSEPAHNTFQLMYRNAEKLMRIINQLLDFRKSEAGLMKIRAEKTNLVFFLREILGSFIDFAKEHHIHLSLECDTEELYAWIDRDQMEKAIFNLLSNAIKFTPNGGMVSLTIEEDKPNELVLIQVADNGAGIPEDQLELVFDPFFQGKNKPRQEHFGGTGIGLALVRAILDRHHGSISVQSTVGQGTAFMLRIPAGFTHLQPGELVMGEPRIVSENTVTDTHGAQPEAGASWSEKPHILIVEDNADIRAYLRANLQSEYQISEAENGIEALKRAREIFPDLILSDIAMPKMDGIELCRRIKSDMLTSHIPFILLTARTSMDYRIGGMEGGADDYISKPFNLQLLELRIRNLIRSRVLLKEKFGRAADLTPSSIASSSLDEVFLNKMLEIVEENMDESDFSIDDLAHRLAMSRMQLYRKIKGLTGQTPNNLIRNIRLKRAAQLLDTQQFNVSEVAYKVGFSDLKYFRERFKEQFGVTPSEYAPKS